MGEYEKAIEIHNLTKKYDGYTLDHVSFSVDKGTVMGFIGQNGAGKSTTIKAILNVINKDEGEIKLFGKDHIKCEREVKEDIAVVFDDIPFNDIFTPLALSKMLRGFYASWDETTFFNYLERFGLPKKKKLGKFSKGMKMKLQIATALSHDAKLLIMDEPTSGLDPVVRNEILDIFREYMQDGERTILMSSHITSDLEKIADSITYIDKGNILLSGYKDEILENYGIIKCTREELKTIDKADFISARVNEFGAEVLVCDRIATKKKYPSFAIENTTLEAIMLFYVNQSAKEWS